MSRSQVSDFTRNILASRAAIARLIVLSVLAGIAFLFSANTADAQTCLSILSYGGNDNGTADNEPALVSAFAALPSNGGCVSFPPGRYKFNSAPALNYPTGIYSVTIVGGGADNTTLYFPASNGISINAQNAKQSIHVRDLTFSTGTAGGYSALVLSNSSVLGTYAQSDIFRTTFRGDDGGAVTDYWANGVEVVGLSNINFDSDLFYGNASGSGGAGIDLNGNNSVSPYYGVVYNVAKSGFYNIGNGLVLGSYIQGVTVTQSNFANGTTGIWAPSGETGLAELAITGGNNFNTIGNQIIIESPLAALIMNGNLIYIAENAIGVWLDAAGSQDSFANNVFTAINSTGTTGIYVGSNVTGSVVVGNVFYNLATGVNLTGTSTWNVQANIYHSVTTDVANIGTNSVGIATK